MTRTNWTIQPREDFRENVDRLRKAEVDLPSRTEMLHRLVSRAVDDLEDVENPIESSNAHNG